MSALIQGGDAVTGIERQDVARPEIHERLPLVLLHASTVTRHPQFLRRRARAHLALLALLALLASERSLPRGHDHVNSVCPTLQECRGLVGRCGSLDTLGSLLTRGGANFPTAG